MLHNLIIIMSLHIVHPVRTASTALIDCAVPAASSAFIDYAVPADRTIYIEK